MKENGENYYSKEEYIRIFKKKLKFIFIKDKIYYMKINNFINIMIGK